MRLELLQSLQIIIIALLSYLPTVAITGWFEAWVAKKCGDDTPEQFGFLTLDPFVHFNIVGFGFLLIGKLLDDWVPFFRGIPGWGRYIPLNPSQTSGWRIPLIFNARAIGHFVLSAIALVVIIQYMKAGYIQFNWNIAPNVSTNTSSLISVLQFFYNQNLMLCIIYFAIGTFRTMMTWYFPDFYMFSSQHIIIGTLILFGSIIICAEFFRFIVTQCMITIMYLLMM